MLVVEFALGWTQKLFYYLREFLWHDKTIYRAMGKIAPTQLNSNKAMG